MGHKILIVDDDNDFNSLLTDVFAQADYEVHSVDSGEAALAQVDDTFKLVVTDHRMPGIAGAEFTKRVLEKHPHLPVVMVSAYLENHVIRELIQAGVGGIFMKPLNIFQLLKKTESLIEAAEERRLRAMARLAEDNSVKNHPRLGFPFASFPCESGHAEQFARQLHGKRDFRSNLLLIGHAGADFDAVCRDLARFSSPPETLLHLSAARFDSSAEDSLREQLENLESLILQVSDIEQADAEISARLIAFSRRESPFTTGAPNRRLVFCLHKDVDALYDEGLLDENLYIFLGTQEIRIPALQSMPEEVPALFYRYWQEGLPESSQLVTPEMTREAEQFLREFDWPGDALQLREIVRQIQQIGSLEIIGLSHLESAVKGELRAADSDQRENLREFLLRNRAEWFRTARLLAHGDAKIASAALGLPEHWLDQEFAKL